MIQAKAVVTTILILAGTYLGASASLNVKGPMIFPRPIRGGVSASRINRQGILKEERLGGGGEAFEKEAHRRTSARWHS